MFDIRNSRRSFNNSWLLHDHVDIPSGVVVDIAVVTPLQGDVYISKMTAEGGSLALSLKQAGKELAYMRTSQVNTPVLMTSEVPGAWVSITLGYIPDKLAFSNNPDKAEPECIICPELVTYFDYLYLSTTSTGSHIVIKVVPPGVGGTPPDSGGGSGGTPPDVIIPWEGPVHIYTDPMIHPSIDPGTTSPPGGGGGSGGGGVGAGTNPSLYIAVKPGSVLPNNGSEFPMGGNFIYTINQVPYYNPPDSIEPDAPTTIPNITIQYKGKPLDVTVIGGVITLESPPLMVCDLADIIDNYIYPVAGEIHVLDECYDCGYTTPDGRTTPKRNTTMKLAMDGATYGFNGSLKLDGLDRVFDKDYGDANID